MQQIREKIGLQMSDAEVLDSLGATKDNFRFALQLVHPTPPLFPQNKVYQRIYCLLWASW